MGIKYTVEYKTIIEDLAEGIYQIENFYDFFEMNIEDWQEYSEKEKKNYASTLADDLFYALATENNINVGKGLVKYNSRKSIIEVFNNDDCIKTIKL